ncbi:MAG: hypothetical protein KBT03_13860 [Bacteroidales bacterium]|nr:hypothetical protein [Candidatus Scybalousia scybalohippi]
MAEPIYKIKSGTQSVAVFTNTYEKDGKTRTLYNLNIQKRYKDKNGEWKNQTISEIAENGFQLAELIKQAAIWCVANKKIESDEQPQATNYNSFTDDNVPF